MVQKISPTNTKAQIFEAYNKLLKQQQEKASDNPKEIKKREETKQAE